MRTSRHHTKECDKTLAESHLARCLYGIRWPDYCKVCEGWGGTNYPGSYYNPPEFDPCPVCQEPDENICRCPRCGAPGETWNEETSDITSCRDCGYDPEYPQGMPLKYECLGECVDDL